MTVARPAWSRLPARTAVFMDGPDQPDHDHQGVKEQGC